jgi:hypothetical protein
VGKETAESPNSKNVLTNSRLRSFRPTTALPSTSFSNSRYHRKRKELEIKNNEYYLAKFKPMDKKAIVSYTSNRVKERTTSTNLTSMDPLRLMTISRKIDMATTIPLSYKNKFIGKFEANFV